MKLMQLSRYMVTSSFGKYLRVPLSGRKLRRYDFQYIVDQIASKLNSWKNNNLSFARRITLTKSVIEVIPLYPMMTNRLAKSCIEDIHGLQRKFIWGDTNEQRKINALGWESLTRPKVLAGIGFRNLEILNNVYLMKLGWKIINNSKDL